MSKIAIVVDSTANLSKLEKEEHQINVIPLFFYFGEDFYEDGEFDQKQFFKLVDEYYNKTKTLPQTSQPSIGACIELFSKLLKSYDHVIYYTMSSKLSGTYQNGVTASNDFPNQVTVIDSLNTSAVLKQLAICASQDAKKGLSVEEIVSRSNTIINNSSIKLVIDDLSHLQRTGRLNATQAVIGSMLKLKPILYIEDGLINPVDKVRNINKALKQLCDQVIDSQITADDYICIAHAEGEEQALNMKSYLESKITDRDIEVTELSGVVSTHTGAGSIGIVVIKDLYKV